MRKLNSFKTKLIGFVSIIIMVATIGGFFFHSKLHDYNKTVQREKYELISKTITNQITQIFGEHYQDLKSLSENLNLSVLSPQELQNKLNKEASSRNHWDLLLIVDPQGGYLSSNTFDSKSISINLDTIKSMPYNNEDWFQSVINNNFSETKRLTGVHVRSNKVDPLITSASNTQSSTLSFSAPIKNLTGETIAIITARVNSGWYESIFQSFYQNNQNLISTPIFQLINDSNTVIYDYSPTLQNNPLITNQNLKPPWHQSSSSKSGFFNSFDSKNGSKINLIYIYTPLDKDHFLSSLNWKILISGNSKETLQFSDQIKWKILLFLIILGFFGLTGSYSWSKMFEFELTQLSLIIRNTSNHIISTSEELDQTTHQLVHVSQNKNHSIEKTTLALKEISTLIKSSTKEVESVNDTANEVNSLTLNTQQWMEELTKAMKAIQESNSKINNLVKIIEEIGEKTEIIDDIVFKTQLLSFNASVEAERAGEHGRGFSVVAQEVGNLAQLSGKAATDISNIVKKSIQEADLVSKENKGRVERGEQLTHETYEKLTHVIQKVSLILKSTSQIATVNKDQDEGISQITSSLNSYSNEISDSQEYSKNYSHQMQSLKGQSKSLNELFQKINNKSNKQSA